jgi:Trk-type K+ transport system membrane component
LLHALVWYFRREAKIMRWKISHQRHGQHDPRQIDLIAIFVLLIVIVTAFRFYSANPAPPSTASFVDPSQSVRW